MEYILTIIFCHFRSLKNLCLFSIVTILKNFLNHPFLVVTILTIFK